MQIVLKTTLITHVYMQASRSWFMPYINSWFIPDLFLIYSWFIPDLFPVNWFKEYTELIIEITCIYTSVIKLWYPNLYKNMVLEVFRRWGERIGCI